MNKKRKLVTRDVVNRTVFQQLKQESFRREVERSRTAQYGFSRRPCDGCHFPSVPAKAFMLRLMQKALREREKRRKRTESSQFRLTAMGTSHKDLKMLFILFLNTFRVEEHTSDSDFSRFVEFLRIYLCSPKRSTFGV